MARGARRCRGRVRGVGAVPPGSDVRYRGDPGGAAHSIGAGRRGTGGIMRKRLSAQRCWNPPMCRAGTSAHGSPSAENLRSRKIPESRGKPGIGSWGRSSPMCNTPARTEKNPTRPRGSPPGARPVQAPREVVTPPTTPILASVPPLPARKAQCTYRCVVLPDTSGASSTRSCITSLNAPTGAWCSLTEYQQGAPVPP